MIPDQYLQLARRWVWLIALCVVLGAVAGLYVVPSVVGSTASFNSEVTLSASRYVSPARVVTAGEASFDDDVVIADYTSALVRHTGTPHFTAALQERLAEQGVLLSREAIQGRLEITADPNLFRIEVRASESTPELADTLAKSAADTLTAKAADDEIRVATTLIYNLELQRQQLDLRGEALERELDIPERLLDRGHKVINVEIHAVDSRLEEITRQRERLILARSLGAPLTQAAPPQTVATEAKAVEPRDMLLLGALGGLVLGWLAANAAERLSPAPAGAALAVPPRLREKPRLDARIGMFEPAAARRKLLNLAQRAQTLEARAEAVEQRLMRKLERSRGRSA